MKPKRSYCRSDLKPGTTLYLPADAVHHLIKVLRHKPEDEVILFNGDGHNYHAKIISVSKKQCQVKILSAEKQDLESPLHIHLFQAIARGEKMDFIIQKAVELGVNEITPIFSKNCNVKLPEDRLGSRLIHWQKVANSASEQCGRTQITQIHSVKDFNTMVHESAKVEENLKILLSLEGSTCFKDLQNCASIILCIGPEGGFSEDEIDYATNKTFQTVKLGPRILRTETAGLTAIALCQNLWGDL